MSRRQALHELQSRLAERMRQVRAEPPRPGWLAVSCAGRGLLLPLAEAGEIFEPRAMLPVPHTRAWFAGLVNLRGGIHTVVDLARFLGLRDEPTTASAPGARAVSLNPKLGLAAALLVDRLDGLRQASSMRRVDEPPAVGDDTAPPAFAGARWLDDDGVEWQEISLDRLAGEAGFLSIAA